MCDFEKGFKLCSCKLEEHNIDKNRKSKKDKDLPIPKLGYRWYLSRFVSKVSDSEFMMEGEFEPPSKDLGNGLSDEWILVNLNLENCFDFEYTPSEGDNLVFKSDEKYIYLSFVYKKGIWIKDNYSPFDTILKKIDEGKIEMI
ncbi:MAG: hypothetical protein SFU98_08605 [Leptospiraceae bacterium]|nr:hypothetical protein [Leptospiraceae bacterium]